MDARVKPGHGGTLGVRHLSANRSSDGDWLRHLPQVRGRLAANAPIGHLTWFRVGGPAELLFRPADVDDLAGFLGMLPASIPVTVIGVGSNLLVRDGGIPGVTIRLGRGFAAAVPTGDQVMSGAGALDLNVALSAVEAGIAGLEFLSGVPGTIGGGLRMNAGAYGGEMSQVTIGARAVDREGAVHVLGPTELGFSYRHSAVPERWIFTAATFAGRAGDAPAICRRLTEIRTEREAAQPIRTKTGGSTFKNCSRAKASFGCFFMPRRRRRPRQMVWT